jgi:hypothetical protein
MTASWGEVAPSITRGGRVGELQQERWAVRGEPRSRETFGLPAHGDFPGKGADTRVCGKARREWWVLSADRGHAAHRSDQH